jgi:aminotransferase class I and II
MRPKGNEPHENGGSVPNRPLSPALEQSVTVTAVRALSVPDISRASAMLAHTFEESPLFRCAFSDPGRRRRASNAIFRAASNAISPVQAAVVLSALRVVRSPEGDELRRRAMAAIQVMRETFARHGMTCLGDPSNIVPVLVGDEAIGRVAFRLVCSRGVMSNLVEFPAVGIGKARFRMQVMASHRLEQVTEAAEIVSACVAEARETLAPGLRNLGGGGPAPNDDRASAPRGSAKPIADEYRFAARNSR